MKLIYNFYVILLCSLCFYNCNSDKANVGFKETALELKEKQKRQDSIIDKYLTNGAHKFSYNSPQWQLEIDKGLEIDSTIAYLWQQKAMPLFKQGKYEIGMEFVDKAVIYNRERWQSYRAFIKCIFAKTYREAIIDFEDYKKRFGNVGYVMDHTYDFHIALSYLQLNEFEKAEEIFTKDYEKQLAEKGKDWLHSVDLFYYGISKFELGKYKEAIKIFDIALEDYPQFSDIQYYKSISLYKIGEIEKARKLYKEAEINGKKGFSINEDNAIYERYPYQVRWR